MTKLSRAELEIYADMFAKSSFFPHYKNNVYDIFYIINKGNDIGLPPAEAMEIISYAPSYQPGKPGRIIMRVKAMLSLTLSHPSCEGINEYFEGEGDNLTAICAIQRKGFPLRKFAYSVQMAKTAGLWGKKGPWITDKEQMLITRARGRGLESVFGDVLNSIYSAEEVADYSDDPNYFGDVKEAKAKPSKMESAAGKSANDFTIVKVELLEILDAVNTLQDFNQKIEHYKLSNAEKIKKFGKSFPEEMLLIAKRIKDTKVALENKETDEDKEIESSED